MQITLSEEALAALAALAAEYHSTPEALVEAFVLDLTGAPGNGGSDERMYAREWLHRNCGPAAYVWPEPLPDGASPDTPVFLRCVETRGEPRDGLGPSGV